MNPFAAALIKNRLFRFAAAALVLVVFAFGYGYLKGYSSAEAKAERKMVHALQDQQDKLLAIAAADRKQVVALLKTEQETRKRFSEIPLPINAACDSDLWLRAYNDAVRLANSRGTAVAAGADAGSQ